MAKPIYSETKTLSNGADQTTIIYDDGSLEVNTGLAEPFKTYFELSDVIQNSRNVQTKLAACEDSYNILPAFVREYLKDSHKLPDTILCRDMGVELYLRTGQWTKARLAIAKCAAAGAYSDDGLEAVNHFERYRRTAELALAFLRENPGFLQKNIYRALPDTDKDCLKAFARSSFLIRKEKFGGTNKLYVQ